MARPIEYKESYLQDADRYLEEYVDEITEFHKLRGEKSDGYDRLVKVRLPTIEGFASFIGVNKTSLYEWEKKFPIFSNALDKIRNEQKRRLIEGGLSGDYNSTIAKLVLSSNHGMSEKTDHTTNGKELPAPIINVIPSNNSDK